ncbi:MAG: hypothetical protein U9Q90_11130 [Campylobacterota bacterium]|nr:hypothetical protein [Campylobacterota bacterium]
MKKSLIRTIWFLVVTFVTGFTLSGCSENYSSEIFCSYKEVFGFATITKIERGVAHFSFTMEDESGHRKQYEEEFEVPVPEGVVTGTEYPSKLMIRQTGVCDKHRLTIIQNIGSTCQIK